MQLDISSIDYSDIWHGYLNIEYLIMDLDFIILTLIENRDKSLSTKISLIEGPKKELDKTIKEYIAKNKEKFLIRYHRCPNCNIDYVFDSKKKYCNTMKQSYKVKEGEDPGILTECGAFLETIYLEPTSKESMHEKASFQLAREYHPASIRFVVSAWIIQSLYPGKIIDKDLKISLSDIFDNLKKQIIEQVQQVNFSLAVLGDSLNLYGRLDLFPKGETLKEKYDDYLAIREKLISCFTRLKGLARKHPEFAELDESPKTFRRFPDPISYPDDLMVEEKKSVKNQTLFPIDNKDWKDVKITIYHHDRSVKVEFAVGEKSEKYTLDEINALNRKTQKELRWFDTLRLFALCRLEKIHHVNKNHLEVSVEKMKNCISDLRKQLKVLFGISIDPFEKGGNTTKGYKLGCNLDYKYESLIPMNDATHKFHKADYDSDVLLEQGSIEDGTFKARSKKRKSSKNPDMIKSGKNPYFYDTEKNDYSDDSWIEDL